MELKHTLLMTLTSCHPVSKQNWIFDPDLSDEQSDLAFSVQKPHKNIVLDGLKHLKAVSEFDSDCSVVVWMWKSLQGETTLSPTSVSPIGCCDDQNSDIRGVRCSEDVGAVIELEWSSWGKWNGKLAGHLPEEVGRLKNLKTL
jgi:hypothetical protein